MDKKTSIGAETAKLAGLQIDCNQKIRNGQISLPEFECFLNLKQKKRRQILLPFMIDAYFRLINVFSIVVPKDYEHTNYLNTFAAVHSSEFSHYNFNITDSTTV